MGNLPIAQLGYFHCPIGSLKRREPDKVSEVTCRSATSFAIASPSPVPPAPWLRDSSARKDLGVRTGRCATVGGGDRVSLSKSEIS